MSSERSYIMDKYRPAVPLKPSAGIELSSDPARCLLQSTAHFKTWGVDGIYEQRSTSEAQERM